MTDFVRDQNLSFLPAVFPHLPEWAKTAAVFELEEMENLDGSAFADPIRRIHPIHTKVAALMSGVYLAAHQVEEDAPEFVNVKRAAELFEISDDLDKVVAAMRDIAVKSASTTPVDESDVQRFALYVKAAEVGGEPVGYYPLTSASQVQDSARALANDFSAGKVPVVWFKDAAIATMKAANHFGLERGEVFGLVADTAEERVPDFTKAKESISMRKYAGVSEIGLGLYGEIIDSAKSASVTLEQAADLIEQIDRHFGVKYAGVQLHPWHLLHGGPTVEALKRAAAHNVILASVMVPALELSKLDEKSVRMSMAKAAADQVMEVVKAAATDAAKASQLAAQIDAEIQREALSLTLKSATSVA